ncbi:MAG: magnesium transporter, partial [Candidatus Aureabacteria bacterium]|nr:magnesium transporter [Candidatus Auribacterota bacterium]
MNYFQKNFIYLSQIIAIPVLDSTTNRKIGYVEDLTAGLKEMYPKVSSLIIQKKWGRTRTSVPWKNVKHFTENRQIMVEMEGSVTSENLILSENEILLKKTFWDKQIVDISGSKVVRVNDLHLLREDYHLWVVHVDIGMKGLFRRLGFSHIIEPFIKWLLSYELKDRLISWKFVQPTLSEKGSGLLALKTRQTRLSELHPADLADIITDLGTEERTTIFQTLDNVTAARTFEELPLKIKLQMTESLGHYRLVMIVNEMAMDEAVDLFSELPHKKVNMILTHMPKDKVEQIQSLLGHSKRIAGSIMNTEYISVKHTLTCSQVMDFIKRASKKKETIYYIYIRDDSDTLIGVVTLRHLLNAAPEKTVTEVMRKRVVKVKVDTDIKDVAEIFYKYNFTVVPVIDKQNKMQGIITMKDAFEAVFREI